MYERGGLEAYGKGSGDYPYVVQAHQKDPRVTREYTNIFILLI
jgi:hypothetical protein